MNNVGAPQPILRIPLRLFNRSAPGPLLSTPEEEPGLHPTTALYRFFDTDRRLLYIGISGQLRERWPKHRRKAPWWEQATFVQVEHWSAEHVALDAERAAIAAELPLFNKRSSKRAAPASFPNATTF